MDTLSVRELQPERLWNNFEDLNAVPRPSKKEEKIIAFMESFLQRSGLDYTVDEVGNIIARKPASAGMENRKPVVLQAHLDMVHQKNSDKNFDFENQGIQSYVDGEWVTADGTTLGADNGIGVAAIMTVLESDSIAHPPLEALFTIDEETGMTGAHHLKPGLLNGEILLNLDTEDDDELSIGCAGGVDTTINWSYSEEETPSGYKAYTIKLTGLKGGHSGMDIIYGRGNANKIMNRILWRIRVLRVRISGVDGGGLRNAIPRESVCLVAVPEENTSQLRQEIDQLQQELKDEFSTTDPNLKLELLDESLPEKVMSSSDQEKLIYAIQCCHDGIRRMSPDVDDLVETSNNVARVLVNNSNAEVLCLQRSNREAAKMDMAYSVAAPFKLIGAEVEHSGSYPGWKLDPNSPMLLVMKDLYRELFSEDPRVIACHAGLECGLLGQHYPDIEMISFGPTIRHPHSPDEKVNIASVQKFWDYFLEALKHIPEKA